MFNNYFDKVAMVATFDGKKERKQRTPKPREETDKNSSKSMLKYLKNRYQNDPEYRELQLQKSRIQNLKRKEEKARLKQSQ
jgi:hypothetical protein